jgi:hypothetical protein
VASEQTHRNRFICSRAASRKFIQPPACCVRSITIGGAADCLTQYFADIEPTRQITIEEGASGQDYPILSQDLARTDFLGPIGIRLTQNGKMIAGISFVFSIDSRLFKLISVVDSKCQAVAQYSNADRGGDRNAFQDSDTLKIELAEGSFSLRFIFWGPADFRFNFLQLG